ncbi:ribonuclease H-like domain, reverse transcriptase, RNA-dependent DNA polymerase [Tanacetum coccineum]
MGGHVRKPCDNSYYSHKANTREKEGVLVNVEVDQIFHEETGRIIETEITHKEGTQTTKETQPEIKKANSTEENMLQRCKHVVLDNGAVTYGRESRVILRIFGKRIRNQVVKSSWTETKLNFVEKSEELLMKELIDLRIGLYSIQTADRKTLYVFKTNNGVGREENWTVLSTRMVVVRMKQLKLPLTFWAEAVRSNIYITQQAYAKVTIPHLRKLDDRSIPMIYLGVEEGSKAYRLYDPIARRKTLSRQRPVNDPKSPITTTNIHLQPTLRREEENAREVEAGDLLLMEEEPRNYKEASTDEKWIEAMEIELDSINKNNTCALSLLHCQPDQKAIVTVYELGNVILEQAVSHKERSKTSTLIVGVYVDDLIITGTPRKEVDAFKSQMKDKFEMSDLGLLAYYLGIEVTQTGGEITIKQTGYINKILKETSMTDSNDTKIPMDPGTKLVKAEDGNPVDATYYRSLIGSLRYLLHTRPDLSYSVGLLSRFMQDPKDHHLKAVKQVIRYIKGTKEHGIIYKKEGGCKITGYSDSSYGINTDQGKGTTGIVFYFGESPITWCTQKQPTVALSSCESEFMAATGAACQALWLKRLLSELTGWEEEKITLKVDNISAIALVRNPVFHGRSKHIDIRYHFIRECVENGHINVKHVSGELQRADILTKALPRLKFMTMRQMLGVQDLGRSNDQD